MFKDILNKDKKDILKDIEDIHGFDLAQSFIALNDEEKEKLYTIVNNDILAEIVSYLEPEDAAEVIQAFDLVKQKDLIENMEPDDAVDIIQEMDEDDQQALISVLDNQEEVLSLINYNDNETGSAMTNLLIKLQAHLDVKQATKILIKEAPDVETISTLFAVDDEDKFLGVVQLKKLLKAKVPTIIKDIIEEYPYVYDKDPIIETITKIRNYAIYEMPVLNENHELLGIVTLDDALDIYEEEAQEDFERLAALPETTDKNVFKTAMHRFPWLLLLLAISIPISLVTSMFEDVLAAVTVLIIFQPLIAGSAGNVATQTLAVTLKMLSKNEEGIGKNSTREIITGLINGLVIGVIAFGVTFLFTSINSSLTSTPLIIALIVGLSLWLTVLIAPMIAVVVPLILKALKIDPAVASGPFITTLIDISAISLYFGLATILLGGV